ncbi:hypothetical protein [Pannonibacter phragmitetus]|uniref:hypothetical protein n=1 Tax=Pannonibacter phragmitetus TaxID=121719 RepID=UPI003D2EF2E7
MPRDLVRIDLDLDPAVGECLQLLTELHGGLVPGVLLVGEMPELEHALGSNGGVANGGKAGKPDGSGKSLPCETTHVFPPLHVIMG